MEYIVLHMSASSNKLFTEILKVALIEISLKNKTTQNKLKFINILIY